MPRPKYDEEQQDQQRRALDELDVAARQKAQQPDPRHAHQRERQADQRAAGEGDQRQQHGPLRGLEQVDEMVGVELDHSGVPSRRLRANSPRPIAQKAAR